MMLSRDEIIEDDARVLYGDIVQEWGEPDGSILDDRRGTLPDFPLHALPAAVARFVTRSAHSAGVIQSSIRSREAALERVAIDLVAKREEASAEIAQLEAEVAGLDQAVKDRTQLASKLIADAKAEAAREAARIVDQARDDARVAVAAEVEKIKARL